jgi:hypothetical protein
MTDSADELVMQVSIDPAAANSSSTVFPYSATYGRTMIKTMLLEADGGKSMVGWTSVQAPSSTHIPSNLMRGSFTWTVQACLEEHRSLTC